jgi:predicted RNA binding protein YcfA (HicA-like mRNA interferase family)
MPKLPVLNGRELVRILGKMGFEIIRREGSHVFLRHPDGRSTVVPIHFGEEIDRGLLNKIIKKDLKMSREEFMRCVY